MRLAKSSPKLKAEPEIFATFSFEAIGTQWQIELLQPVPLQRQTSIQDHIKQRIATFDSHYSRFRDDSLVAQMAQHAGRYVLPADAQPLLDMYQKMYLLTDAMVTPLIGQALSDAGYNKNYSLQPHTLQPSPPWDAVLDYDFPSLRIKEPVLLDFGAAGKGYLVDLIAELLEVEGVKAFCINAGGDIWYQHPDNLLLSVGLEHPDDPTQVIGIARLPSRTALCGSAGNRRKWANFHHILNPKTLQSPTHIRALWVTADNCMVADAVAMALFFVPAARLEPWYTFEYAKVADDLSLDYSHIFPATFFNEEG
jgi:thiamine biosynthesis lipoprotein